MHLIIHAKTQNLHSSDSSLSLNYAYFRLYFPWTGPPKGHLILSHYFQQCIQVPHYLSFSVLQKEMLLGPDSSFGKRKWNRIVAQILQDTP